ncbi:neutral zinc metallopeptidase [Planctellipticum variicoloris]|uniref:KPN_02809 family neutral zinc metallopeptidase n=1 Tax=Planctellipticum variicoloris TaxID=3064265 RepID=UPI003013817B|nr:zinc metallopeptidase [Planctomycetaceae bacterium SH412]
MRWQGRRQSDNIDDRRSAGPARVGLRGGLVVVVIAAIAVFLGADPRDVLRIMQNLPAPQPQVQVDGDGRNAAPQPDDELAEFVSVVLADTEEVWTEQFARAGKTYRKPKLVLFRDQVRSACGFASAASGPFYCPADQQVYIDLAFYQDMKDKLGAPGDFAQAYVIAHEVGHHVQNLLGVSEDVHARQQRVDKVEANELSVRLELQADFLAGVWAHHAEQKWQILEQGDIEEALNAATAIGDDRLQQQSRGTVVPESFTHGTSQQRVRWFTRGLKTGDMNAGDTFSVRYSDL